jgi:hypothetical protein
MVQVMSKLDIDSMRSAMVTMCTRLEMRGFSVNEVVVDLSNLLVALVGNLSMSVTMVSSRAHVKDTEVKIKGLKGRIRASTSGLPYHPPVHIVTMYLVQ